MDTYNAYDIYNDIRTRTGGDIYLGVVGPVRTGKSTFIRKFANLMILPYVEDVHTAERIRDELPQSGAGRSIMTTEPKFVPAQAAEISLGDISCRVRLIDCVGYMVEGASGSHDPEDSSEMRMISTPWSEEPVPFSTAAETGTRKVITEHSTIGIVVTTDGSISSIPRHQYEEPEARIIEELKKAKKPFIILLNSTDPYSEETLALVQNMQEKYQAPVLPADCLHMTEEDIAEILTDILYQFPVSQINLRLPGFIDGLDISHNIKQKLITEIREWSENIESLRDVLQSCEKLKDDEDVKAVVFRVNSPGGSAYISDQIWKQVVELKKVKPIVVSMGDYAASGGYYISCAANKIVAEPTTLTGSIGVFGVIRNLTGLLGKVGLTTDVVKTNNYADLGDMSRPMREDEKALIQKSVEKTYDTFLSRCADGRGMSKDSIDHIGQGRVWTGEQALKLGLVDELGGIDTAIEIAAQLAELDNDYVVTTKSGKKDFFTELFEKQLEDVRLELIKGWLGDEEYELYRSVQEMKAMEGIQARLPFDVRYFN